MTIQCDTKLHSKHQLRQGRGFPARAGLASGLLLTRDFHGIRWGNQRPEPTKLAKECDLVLKSSSADDGI